MSYITERIRILLEDSNGEEVALPPAHSSKAQNQRTACLAYLSKERGWDIVRTGRDTYRVTNFN